MPPRSRMCHICGRQCMVNSFQFHVKECQALFEKRENLKPVRERRACPEDPYKYHKGQTLRKSDIDDMNAAAYEAWNKTLSQCANCGRRFLPEKLVVHNRSCSAKAPARSVSTNLTPANPSIVNEPVPQLRRRSSGRSLPSQTPIVPAELLTCEHCGRHFNEIAYNKHHRVCKKVFASKRKPFDSAKARARGTDLEVSYFAKKSVKNNSSLNRSSRQSGNKPSKWRTESMQFREAIRAAREHQRQMSQHSSMHRSSPVFSTGRTSTPSPPLPRGSYNSYTGLIPCPSCGRSFNEVAAARHIPQCRNIIHKPSVLMRGSGHAAYSTSASSSTSAPRPRSAGVTRRPPTDQSRFPGNTKTSNHRELTQIRSVQTNYRDVKDIYRNGPSGGGRRR